ncbi:MAG: PASTA domain-containing protein [Acidobacteria bacterium]|nr:PASTA domain-containing protein [Acidobacteriota bacterium]
MAATLTVIAIVCFIVLPAIALSQLVLSVRRERISRPRQTRVPSIIGLKYETAETTLLKSNLRIRILANRYDLPFAPGLIISQSPQADELVDHGTFVGVTISQEHPDNPDKESP